jgi:uncharacterized protein (TIGR00251 family)
MRFSRRWTGPRGSGPRLVFLRLIFIVEESGLAQPDTDTSINVRVRLQPKASRSEVLGFYGDVLRVRVTAPPERGKANQALIDLLASALGLPKSRIRVLRGHTSRDKLIAVESVSQDDLRRRLGGT